MRPLRAAAAVFLLLALSVSAAAAQDPYEERMWEIAEKVACPVCEGQSVKDSNAQLAREIRALIVERLRLGDDPDAIIQFLADRYGEGILMDPPKTGLGLGVWIGPLIFLAAGMATVAYLLTRRPRGLSPSYAHDGAGPQMDEHPAQEREPR